MSKTSPYTYGQKYLCLGKDSCQVNNESSPLFVYREKNIDKLNKYETDVIEEPY